MKNSCAFTLIELLVVVLIIGILAAVALPQYQVAVAKSRYATIKNLADSVAKAQEVYYLANGKYPDKLQDLDVEMPGDKNKDKSTDNEYWYSWGSISVGSAVVGRYGDFDRDSASIQYQVFGDYSDNPGRRVCVAEGGVSVWDKVCKNETQRVSPNKFAGDESQSWNKQTWGWRQYIYP